MAAAAAAVFLPLLLMAFFKFCAFVCALHNLRSAQENVYLFVVAAADVLGVVVVTAAVFCQFVFCSFSFFRSEFCCSSAISKRQQQQERNPI